jgi:hypothetical protein
MRCKYLVPAAVVTVMMMAGGCLFSPEDDPGGGGTPPPKYEFPDTPDKLMSNFQLAYSGLDINQYRNILHPDFIFKFLEADVDALNLPSDRLFKDEELLSAQKMFSGSPGVDPLDGTPVAGISDITFELFDREGTWEGTDDAVDFPGTQKAVFNTQVSFLRPGSTTIIVDGQTIFYVAARDSTVNGVTRDYYQLRGWVDRTATK